MTIFDSIKYPLSIMSDTVHNQLSAVPDSIKRKWVNHPEYYYPTTTYSKGRYRTLIHIYPTEENITLLKRIIQDYNT